MRGGQGDLRNTLSSRPFTSLSDSSRPTRSMEGVDPSRNSKRPTRSVEGVEFKRLCPSKQRADAQMRLSKHALCSLVVVLRPV